MTPFSEHRSPHRRLRRIQRRLYNAVHPDGAYHQHYLRVGVIVGIALGLGTVLLMVMIQALGASLVQQVAVASAAHIATH